MLRSMGANVTELNDGMVIDGPTPLCSAIIDTQHDHRIAMSAAIAALCTQDGRPEYKAPLSLHSLRFYGHAAYQ